MGKSEYQTRARLLHHLFVQGRRGALFNMFSAFLVFSYFNLTDAPLPELHWWFAIIIPSALVRFALSVQAVHHRRLRILQKYHTAMLITVFVNGALWGGFYCLWFKDMSMFQQLFAALLITSGTTLSISAFSASLPCYLAFIGTTLFPMIATLALAKHQEYIYFGAAITLYTVFILYIFLQHRQALKDDTRLQIAQSQFINRLQSLNQRLEETASTDGLTGLANRRHFNQHLREDWLRCVRSGLPIGILLIDVDYFKQYNDHYGHLGGDQCLLAIAQLLQHFIRRGSDLAARFGGDEMAIVLFNTPLEGALQIAHTIHTRMQETRMPHAGSPFGFVTLSIGVISGIPHGSSDEDHLLAQADAALYRVKHLGRNRVEGAPLFHCDEAAHRQPEAVP